jgi:hypothetical protein
MEETKHAHRNLAGNHRAKYSLGRLISKLEFKAKMEETKHAHRNLVGNHRAKYPLGRLISTLEFNIYVYIRNA